MADGPGQCGKRHHKHTGAYCGFQLISQQHGQHHQHHHAAARSEKAADQPNQRPSGQSITYLLCSGTFAHGIFGCEDGEKQEPHTENPSHEDRETAQCTALYIGGKPAPHHCHAQHSDHHGNSVPYVHTAIFCIGPGTCRTGQHITGQCNADGLVSGNTQEYHQHRGDNRSGA